METRILAFVRNKWGQSRAYRIATTADLRAVIENRRADDTVLTCVRVTTVVIGVIPVWCSTTVLLRMRFNHLSIPWEPTDLETQFVLHELGSTQLRCAA